MFVDDKKYLPACSGKTKLFSMHESERALTFQSCGYLCMMTLHVAVECGDVMLTSDMKWDTNLMLLVICCTYKNLQLLDRVSVVFVASIS